MTYRVIIAEDEPLVRAGVKDAISWEKFDMTVIADVSNGQEAWDAYVKYKPDLIITDIKMPVMNGMELIERVRKQDKSTKIIILSCLDEFDRVRKAFTLGISDYISKLTMTTGEMQHVVSKVFGEMKLNPNETKVPANALEKLQFKENLLKDYLFGSRFSEQEFTSLVAELQWRIHSANPMLLCLIEIDDYDRLLERYKDEYGLLTRMSLLNVLDEIVGDYAHGEVVHDQRNRYILLFSSSQGGERIGMEIQPVLHHIRQAFATYFGTSLTIGVSNAYSGYSLLKTMYKESKSVLKRKFVVGLETTLWASEDVKELFRAKVHRALTELMESWNLTNPILQQELCAKVKDFLERDELDQGDIVDFFLFLMQVPILVLKLQGEQVSKHYQQYFVKIRLVPFLLDACEVFNHYLHQLMLLQEASPVWSSEVKKSIRYIEIQYRKEITVKDLSAHVNLSTNYLSTLFKKETGYSPIEYLIQYRIGKAKALLMESDKRTYEIADMVGISDYSYFSRVFKKTTGKSPSEFRKLHRNVGTWSETENEDQT